MPQEISDGIQNFPRVDLDQMIEPYLFTFKTLRVILLSLDKNSTLENFKRELLKCEFYKEDLFQGSNLREMVQQAMEFLKELRQQIYDIAYQTYLPQLESVPEFSNNLADARQRMEHLLFGAYDLDLPKVDKDFECFDNEGAPLISA